MKASFHHHQQTINLKRQMLSEKMNHAAISRDQISMFSAVSTKKCITKPAIYDSMQ